MELKTIQLSLISESADNPRGKDFAGPAFNDLVASVKEKGVLVPIIVRPKGKDKFEVVAGNRRLRAAKEAGMNEIPARIEKFSDAEAREIQIIENLQREDVHPIEEGQAYRELVEKSHYEIRTIAARVGKSESYVRYRLFLTNLCEKARIVYRQGKFTDGHAVLMAGLSPNDQLTALKHLGGEYRSVTVKEFSEWIKKTFQSPMEFQPWIGNKELMEIVGSCVECPPNKSSLFGDFKEGQCTDMKCWKRKIGKYFDYIAKKEKLVKVSSEFNWSSDASKASGPYGKVVLKNDYEIVPKKGKEHCESAHGAILIDGVDIGKKIEICTNKECKIHRSGHSYYAPSPAEKAARKREAQKKKKREESNIGKFIDTLDKVEFPLSKKHLDALLDFAIYRCGKSYQQPAVKLMGAEVVKTEEESYGYDGKTKKVMRINYEASLRKYAEANGDSGKLRVIFALLMPHPDTHPWGDDADKDFNNAIKKL